MTRQDVTANRRWQAGGGRPPRGAGHEGGGPARARRKRRHHDERLTLFLDLFDRVHQRSQRQLAGLHHRAPGPRTAVP
jgi:hypothetical protein